MLLRLNTQSQ